jgi:hypothetical protein
MGDARPHGKPVTAFRAASCARWLCLAKADLASAGDLLHAYAPLGIGYVVLGRPLDGSGVAGVEQAEHLGVQQAVGGDRAAAVRGRPAGQVGERAPASSTITMSAARSHSDTSGSAQTSTAPSATSTCDQKSP